MDAITCELATLLGCWSVTWVMAAVISLAVPSMAWATGLLGLASWPAICAWDRPART